MGQFTESEWERIHRALDGREAAYGFPEWREDSVVLASFNIRDFGKREKRSAGAWRLLGRICERFDLIAVQEVEDRLDSLFHLQSLLGEPWELVCSDITGARPADIGGIAPHERLAFLYRTDRVRRTWLCSDITFDRSYIFKTLYGNREAIWEAFEEYRGKYEEWQAGTRRTKPYFIKLPEFISFIRQPHCVSFEIAGEVGSEPYEILAVNAHLLYGGGLKSERRREFDALIEWLLDRAKKLETMPVKNIVLLGDLNFDFSNPERQRPEITDRLKGLNSKAIGGDVPAELNFPFLDAHPRRGGVIRTNARLSETFDQIAILRHDKRLPGYTLNETAGRTPGGFDFDAVDFARLFVDVLRDGEPVDGLSTAEKRVWYGRFDFDVSDHLPIWIRLPLPFAGQPEN